MAPTRTSPAYVTQHAVALTSPALALKLSEYKLHCMFLVSTSVSLDSLDMSVKYPSSASVQESASYDAIQKKGRRRSAMAGHHDVQVLVNQVGHQWYDP